MQRRSLLILILVLVIAAITVIAKIPIPLGLDLKEALPDYSGEASERIKEITERELEAVQRVVEGQLMPWRL